MGSLDAHTLDAVHHWQFVDAHEHFGVLGNGSNEKTKLQAAIDATPTGGTLFIPRPPDYYGINGPLTISKAMTIVGYGSEIRTSATTTQGLQVTASDVHLEGLKVAGPNNSANSSNSRGIECIGSVGTPLANIVIKNCEVANWRMQGVYLHHVSDFLLQGNYLHDLRYAGIQGFSVLRGRISANEVRSVTATDLAYGISLTRIDDDSLAVEPRSADIVVVGNYVEGVTNWEGIDTHAGERITIVGNTIKNCKRGIACVPAPDDSAVDQWAPLNVTVMGNSIESGVTDGTYSEGIVFTGAGSAGSVTEAATGSIVGNSIKNHGFDDAGGLGCAVLAQVTEGLAITGNHIVNPSPHGINLYHTNRDFNISGNVIIDPWSDDFATPRAVTTRSTHNTGFIGGNTFGKDSKSATNVMPYALRFDGANNVIQLGFNHGVDAGTRVLYDQNGVTSSVVETSLKLSASGVAINGYLGGSKTWDPGDIADDAMTSTTVTVTGAAIGNLCTAGFSTAIPAGALLTANVTATDTVTVTLHNNTGANLDLASGTLKVGVWQQ